MRETRKITITAPLPSGKPSRDHGRTYLLTEMSAAKAEKWAARAFLAISRSGVAVPPDAEKLGMVGVLLVGYQALRFSRFEDLEPLMDEMFSCVSYVMEGDQQVTRPLLDGDIEEVYTRGFIRKELLELHAGFTFADAASWLTTSASMSSSTPQQ